MERQCLDASFGCTASASRAVILRLKSGVYSGTTTADPAMVTACEKSSSSALK